MQKAWIELKTSWKDKLKDTTKNMTRNHHESTSLKIMDLGWLRMRPNVWTSHLTIFAFTSLKCLKFRLAVLKISTKNVRSNLIQGHYPGS